ncbi:HAMP domain-containing histidine kinase [Clostridium sporogenes]|nr:HAMP domain-containing histidine kinase [Clostridium sporogenes]NFF99607.1 HAMP domain-containing histidine kinase [Clostridium sporogenes]NFG05673.1 HAMP domain-containing histidine kinase [Clostridium sporogenes]NFG49826.1 HAMP domain-containing histidine kinase [Clostridium sporogenes]NFP85042.1 HAMP domain-containing histidine kinase [Clostridium sporogenes]
MKRLRFKSLTMRIWTTFTAIILIIICSISFLYLVAFKRISENSKLEDLKVAHDVLLNSNNFNEQNRFDELKSLKGSDHFIAKIDENDKYKIIDIGKRKEEPPPIEKKNPPPRPASDEIKMWMASYIIGNNIQQKQFKEYHNNVKFIFIISSIKNAGGEKLYLISYIPEIQDNVLLYTVIIIGVVFIGIGFFTAKLVANYISRPLRELEDYTVKIAHKDWREPVKIKNDDEIGRLVDSMNRMQKELKKIDEEEKMFLQSISHDLKTPVMVIMSHAQAIIDGMYIESVEETAEIIKDEAAILEKKIKQLLYLNTLAYSLENNSENIGFELHNLLFNIISRFEIVNSKIQWNLDIDKVVIKGNPEKIRVAIENILDNGLRYAEGQISVTLKKENSVAVLEFYNDGPNIDKNNIDHIFKNLYKDRTGNFGLGLAISKKIIDFYNGEIKAVNRDNGVSFIIKYPID